jgi:hypothetical protein
MSSMAEGPSEEELEVYFDKIMDESESAELIFDPPIATARKYYVEGPRLPQSAVVTSDEHGSVRH